MFVFITNPVSADGDRTAILGLDSLLEDEAPASAPADAIENDLYEFVGTGNVDAPGGKRGQCC